MILNKSKQRKKGLEEGARLDVYYTKEWKNPVVCYWDNTGSMISFSVFLATWAAGNEPDLLMFYMHIIYFALLWLWVVLSYVHILSMIYQPCNSVSVEGEVMWFFFSFFLFICLYLVCVFAWSKSVSVHFALSVARIWKSWKPQS